MCYFSVYSCGVWYVTAQLISELFILKWNLFQYLRLPIFGRHLLPPWGLWGGANPAGVGFLPAATLAVPPHRELRQPDQRGPHHLQQLSSQRHAAAIHPAQPRLLHPRGWDARVGGTAGALRRGDSESDIVQWLWQLWGCCAALWDRAAATGRGAEDGLLLVHSAHR